MQRIRDFVTCIHVKMNKHTSRLGNPAAVSLTFDCSFDSDVVRSIG